MVLCGTKCYTLLMNFLLLNLGSPTIICRTKLWVWRTLKTLKSSKHKSPNSSSNQRPRTAKKSSQSSKMATILSHEPCEERSRTFCQSSKSKLRKDSRFSSPRLKSRLTDHDCSYLHWVQAQFSCLKATCNPSSSYQTINLCLNRSSRQQKNLSLDNPRKEKIGRSTNNQANSEIELKN